ncbi:MAG: hypothetical protein R3E12_15345 [Candidatus Eisenbacteria bacterium]
MDPSDLAHHRHPEHDRDALVHVRYDAFLDLPYYDGVGFRFLVLGRKICPQTGLPAWEPTYEPGSPVVAGWPLQCAAQEYVIEVECGRDWDALRVILEIRQDCEWYSGEPSLCTGNSNLSPLLDNLQVGFHEGNVRTLEVFTFFDVNGNGVRDLPESAAIPDALVAVDPEGLAAITGSEGRVQFEGLSAHAHTVTAVPPPNWEVTTSGGAPVPIDLADCPPPPSTLTRLDIGMRPVENQSDLRISAWAIRAKAGSGTQFEGGWMNWGSTTQNVTVSASIPPQIIVNYVDPTPTGGTLNNPVWSYPSVPPGAVHYFTILGDVPSSTPLGAVLTSTFQVEPIAGDVSPANNVVQVEQTVVGPLDPNDKEVFPAGPIPPDQLITYVVHFQNVGTAEATNIVITDDLDPNLNIATLIQGAASHLHSFDVNGRTLRWTFENIDLPPQSEDDVGSQGFVTFQVRPADGIPAGTQIDNSAVITFDFADPIETNVVSSWVVDPADVDPEPADDGATVHFALTSLGPNPITRTIKMEFAVPGPGEVTVDLIDASGRKVWSSQERATPGTYSVRWDGSAGDAGPLPEGVYFARGRFQGDDGTSAAAGRRVVLLRQ